MREPRCSEAASDASSVTAFEGLRLDTLYTRTGGAWAPATEGELGALATRPDIRLVALTAPNMQGDIFGDRIRAITTEARCSFGRLRSQLYGWNDDLRQIMRRAR